MSKENGQAQRRIIDMILLLSGNEFIGLSPSEIARHLKATPSSVTRDLQVLKDKNIAVQIEDTGRWALGPRMVQIGLAFSTHIDKQRSRLNETENRYTRKLN